jgi:lipopolysaccharide/colanic/teichoic acid biosynthesis glycosyltransferase
MLKRFIDFLVALCTLLLLLPLMLVIAAIVRLTSPGPALFRQQRVGRQGRVFLIYKFRTMTHHTAPTVPLISADSDARITKSGYWLRASKLDELPQLFNVLMGDMSIVGPRPEVPKYVALYPEELRTIVLSVRPGITDEESIEFRNESAMLADASDPEQLYVTQIMPRKLELCAKYVAARTLLGDARIVCCTVWQVINKNRKRT